MVPDDSGTGLKIARAKESFRELTLKGSDLKAVAPLFGSRETRPTFTRELYQVRWRPNDPIDLYVILPAGVKNPPVVIYMYGFPTETDRFKNDAWCQRVTKNGAGAIGFVSALTGQRYNYRPFKENFLSQLPEALTSTVHDVTMVLDYLQTRGDIDMGRIGMFGQGSGGAIAILAASAEKRITAIDLLDPWGDWPNWFATAPIVPEKQRADFLKPEFQEPLQALEPIRVLPALKLRGIRLIEAPGDGVSDLVFDHYQAAAPAYAKVNRYPTADALYDATSAGRLYQWMAATLDAHPSDPHASDAHPAVPQEPATTTSAAIKH